MDPVETVRSPAPTLAPDRPRIDAPARGLHAGLVAFYVFVAAMSLLQQPGRTTYDTRAELTQRPWDFLGEAFTLWHPDSNFGEFQNQAYGYLFPQGSWFALTDLLQVPDWVGQRLWSALILVVACEGARRVARALDLSAPTAVLAGLVFAFSPRLLGTVSVITGESLPGAVLPWVLLPVLLRLRGELSSRRAVVLSGAAVVCMGGVNAVENIAALPLVVVVVLWAWRRGLVPRTFALAWAAAVGVASAWWLLPLLVLAGYAPPFYEYVESAANTTALVGASEAVRGDSHWVAYLIVGDQQWWPAANDLVSSPLLVIVSALVAAAGLWGLVHLRHPARGPLVLAAAIGLGALTIAHGSWEGSPVAGPMRGLLDGALQIFRNVHKVDPTVRLPLAIGVAQAATLALGLLVRRRPRWEQASTSWFVLPMLLVVSLGQPYLVDNSRTPGWEEISPAWTQAQDYLAEHQDGRTTLVVPGSGFALNTWGWTLDEPLQVLGGVDRATRSQIPLIPGESIRFLGALDALVSTGRADASLADQLARAGIGHLVIRRDLLRGLTGSPYPGGASVSAAQGGLELVASFGAPREGGSEVEILEVPQRSAVVRTTPLDEVITVRGAPEAVLGLQRQGLVEPEQATVLEGEPGWEQAAEVVTDTDQRRERAFGVNDESVSAVLGPEEPYRTDRAAHDFPTVPDAGQVTARYDGLRSLTASSAQGYADNFGPVVPQAAPYAAVDGDPDTRWVSSAATRPDDQWLRLEFDEPREVHQVRVLPVVEDRLLTPIRSLEVRAGSQVREVGASPSGAASVVAFDGSAVPYVEVRVARAASGDVDARIGLREVSVDGLTPTRSLEVPGEGEPGASWVFATTAERRACAITVGAPDCDDSRIRGSEEPAGIDRTFASAAPGAVSVRGAVVARTTREAARLLEPVRSRAVGATSIYGDDPKVSDRFAYDGDPTTVWASADADPGPTLFLSFGRERTLDGLRVTTGFAGRGPVSALVRSGDRVRAVEVVDGVLEDFRPLTGRTFDLSFEVAPSADRVTIAELEVSGARLTRAFDPSEPTGAVCGLGPRVVVDGQVVATRVTGTLGDVVNGNPLQLEGCTPSDRAGRDGGPATLLLGAGSHRLTAPPTREFQVTEVAVVAAGAGVDADAEADGADGATRTVEVAAWGDSRRVIEVAEGAAALLHLPENFNTGWQAELDGRVLQPLRVDGWQQGWVLPAGPGGEVTLTYRPQRVYDVLLPAGLALSGALLLAGLGALLLPALRRRGRGRGHVGSRASDPDVDPTVWLAAAPPPARRTALLLVPVVLLVLGPVCAVGFAVGAYGDVLPGASLRRVLGRARVTAVGAALVVLSALLDVGLDAAFTRSWGDAAAALGVGLLLGTVLAAPGIPVTPKTPTTPVIPRPSEVAR